MNMAKLFAPWTPEQVQHLNEWQMAGFVHPFTCRNDHKGDRILYAKEDGWHCWTCDYRQDWCHDFMADLMNLKQMKDALLAKGFKLDNDDKSPSP